MAPRTRLIALNNNAGPLVTVLALGGCTTVTAREDEAASSQGLQFVYGDDVNANLNTVGTVGSPGVGDAPQIELSDEKRHGTGAGRLVGLGPQATNFGAATTLFKAQSRSASPTTLRVREYD